jgi:hypothetical protein
LCKAGRQWCVDEDADADVDADADADDNAEEEEAEVEARAEGGVDEEGNAVFPNISSPPTPAAGGVVANAAAVVSTGKKRAADAPPPPPVKKISNSTKLVDAIDKLARSLTTNEQTDTKKQKDLAITQFTAYAKKMAMPVSDKGKVLKHLLKDENYVVFNLLAMDDDELAEYVLGLL